jgi:hypothetical protein
MHAAGVPEQARQQQGSLRVCRLRSEQLTQQCLGLSILARLPIQASERHGHRGRIRMPRVRRAQHLDRDGNPAAENQTLRAIKPGVFATLGQRLEQSGAPLGFLTQRAAAIVLGKRWRTRRRRDDDLVR